jgi:hypothetical protein
MLQIVIILGWLLAFGLAIHLAARALKHRLLERQRRRLAFRKMREFRRHHYFDRKRRRWVRNVDGVALIDQAAEDRWFMLAFLGWLLFVLWEGYWISEIVERFRNFTHPLQLPYVTLFFILVVVPLAVYLFFRRLRRRRLARFPV